MLNPADASYGLVGVYSPDISELMGESLMRLGMQHALVVHSCGLDELTPMGPAGALAGVCRNSICALWVTHVLVQLLVALWSSYITLCTHPAV
jgi:anthranilate phosphoribosyltransferase